MKHRIGLSGIFFFFSLFCMAQDTTMSEEKPENVSLKKYERTTEGAVRIVFYNVENLFDTINDPNTNDEEFLPSGVKGWGGYRYHQKLDNIFKTLAGLGGWDMPAIVGFCEIENRSVLYDLIHKTPLQTADYQIVHEDSPDRRGVDVGLIYRPDIFQPISHEAMNVTFPFDTATRTRDVLYVKGTIHKHDTIHIFINHWPSRWGGAEASAPRRIYVAELIRKKVDSLYAADKNPNIIITGDFNDEPGDVSITEGLKAKGKIEEVKPGDLYNCMYGYWEKGIGTEKYQEHWGLLDQYIISEPLLNKEEGLVVDQQTAYIFDAPWLVETDQKFLGTKPFRTYSGPKYIGGYSDHFPVYIDLVRKKKTN